MMYGLFAPNFGEMAWVRAKIFYQFNEMTWEIVWVGDGPRKRFFFFLYGFSSGATIELKYSFIIKTA